MPELLFYDVQPQTCFIPSKAEAVGSFEVEDEEATAENSTYDITEWTADQINDELVARGYTDVVAAAEAAAAAEAEAAAAAEADAAAAAEANNDEL